MYHFLVLFGIPEKKFKIKENGSIWKAIVESIGDHDDVQSCKSANKRRGGAVNSVKKGKPADRETFVLDRNQFSLTCSTDEQITRARENLQVKCFCFALFVTLLFQKLTHFNAIGSTFCRK